MSARRLLFLAFLTTILGKMSLVLGQQESRLLQATFQTDPRLQKPLTFAMSREKVSTLLQLITKETSVPLSMEPSLETRDPRFATISTINVPTWKILEEITQHNVKGSSWQQAGNGYRLFTAPAVTGQSSDSPFKSYWGYYLLISLLALALAAGAIWYPRRKRQRGF